MIFYDGEIWKLSIIFINHLFKNRKKKTSAKKTLPLKILPQKVIFSFHYYFVREITARILLCTISGTEDGGEHFHTVPLLKPLELSNCP